jgi:hypothetical protein
LEASRFIPVLELKESEALIFYKARRVHLIDRMMEEYDKNRSENYQRVEGRYHVFQVQEKERATKTDYDDY